MPRRKQVKPAYLGEPPQFHQGGPESPADQSNSEEDETNTPAGEECAEGLIQTMNGDLSPHTEEESLPLADSEVGTAGNRGEHGDIFEEPHSSDTATVIGDRRQPPYVNSLLPGIPTSERNSSRASASPTEPMMMQQMSLKERERRGSTPDLLLPLSSTASLSPPPPSHSVGTGRRMTSFLTSLRGEGKCSAHEHRMEMEEKVSTMENELKRLKNVIHTLVRAIGASKDTGILQGPEWQRLQAMVGPEDRDSLRKSHETTGQPSGAWSQRAATDYYGSVSGLSTREDGKKTVEHARDFSAALGGRDGGERHACRVCKQRFSAEYSLDTHMCGAAGDKSLTCQLCSKEFSNRRDLTVHLYYHQISADPERRSQMAAGGGYHGGPSQLHSRTGSPGEGEGLAGDRMDVSRIGGAANDSDNQKYSAANEPGLRQQFDSLSKGSGATSTPARASGACSEPYDSVGLSPYDSIKQMSGLGLGAGESVRRDPNQCHVCQRILSCKSALQMHYRTHTGERPFKCNMCNRAFTTKGNLKTHMGVHRAKEDGGSPPGHAQPPHQLAGGSTQPRPVATGLSYSLPLAEPSHPGSSAPSCSQSDAGQEFDLDQNESGAEGHSPLPADQRVTRPNLGSESSSTDPPRFAQGSLSDGAAIMAADGVEPMDVVDKPLQLTNEEPESANVAKPGGSSPIQLKDNSLPTASRQSEGADRRSGGQPAVSSTSLDALAGYQAFAQQVSNLQLSQLQHYYASAAQAPLLAAAGLLKGNPYGVFGADSTAVVAGQQALAESMASAAKGLATSPAPTKDVLPAHRGGVQQQQQQQQQRKASPVIKEELIERREEPLDRSSQNGKEPLNEDKVDPKDGQTSGSHQDAPFSSGWSQGSASSAVYSSLYGLESGSPAGTVPERAGGTSTGSAADELWDVQKFRSAEGGATSQQKDWNGSLGGLGAAIGNPGSSECSICHKRFSCRSAMLMHYRTHTKEKPFDCPVCSKAFTTKGNMRQHMLTHASDVNMGVAAPSQLERARARANAAATGVAMRSQASAMGRLGSRPSHDSITLGRMIRRAAGGKHQCLTCQKFFSSASALQIHTRTHTGDKPFKCDVCSKAFTTKGNLKVHQSIHGAAGGIPRPRRQTAASKLKEAKSIAAATAKSQEFMQQASLLAAAGAAPYGALFPGGIPTAASLYPGMAAPLAGPLSGGGILGTADSKDSHLITSSSGVSAPVGAGLTTSTAHDWTRAMTSCHLCGFECTSKEQLRVHIQGHANIGSAGGNGGSDGANKPVLA